jgi:hypothetical protein
MSEGGEPSAPATPGLLLLSYTTPRDAASWPGSVWGCQGRFAHMGSVDPPALAPVVGGASLQQSLEHPTCDTHDKYILM